MPAASTSPITRPRCSGGRVRDAVPVAERRVLGAAEQPERVERQVRAHPGGLQGGADHTGRAAQGPGRLRHDVGGLQEPGAPPDLQQAHGAGAARRGRHAVAGRVAGRWPAAGRRTRSPAGAPASGPRTVVEVIGPSQGRTGARPVAVSGR